MCGEGTQQRIGCPVGRPPLAGVSIQSLDHAGEADRIGIGHRPAALPRKSVPVAPDSVDVGGRRGDSLLEYPRAFADKRENTARHDLLVVYLPAHDAKPGRLPGYQLIDGGIRLTVPLPVNVPVEAQAGLLAQPSALDQSIGDAIEPRIGRACGPGPPGVIADIETGEIAHRIGAHRHAERLERPIDESRGGSLQHQELFLPTVGIQHSVADEAKAVADNHSHLTHRLTDGNGAREDIPGRISTPHNLQQAHHVRRAEEMHSDTVRGPTACRGDRINVDRRGVGCKDGTRLHNGCQVREQRLLDGKVLEHRLDHEIGRAQLAGVRGTDDPRPHLRGRTGGDPALGYLAGEERLDPP